MFGIDRLFHHFVDMERVENSNPFGHLQDAGSHKKTSMVIGLVLTRYTRVSGVM